MTKKILINAMDPDEHRIATIKENKLEQFHISTTARQATQGNIYKGVVSRVEPSLQQYLSITAKTRTVSCRKMKYTKTISRK